MDRGGRAENGGFVNWAFIPPMLSSSAEPLSVSSFVDTNEMKAQRLSVR
jgi:hypothetical protein